MQVYRLEPKNGDTSDRDWDATSLKEACWVSAETENEAREKVTLATIIATKIEPGTHMRTSPWMTGLLTTCMVDNAPSNKPPDGYVRMATGRTISLPGVWGPAN